MSELTLSMLEADRRVKMHLPTDDVTKRFIIDQRFEDGVWYLWEQTKEEFGSDMDRVKTGDVNTVLAELARRMRDV